MQTSGSTRSHSISPKILLNVHPKNNLQKYSLSSSTCKRALRRAQHFETRISSSYTEDFLPRFTQHVMRMASLFGSTYICEKSSTMAINKSKLRSRLTDVHLQSVLRISTTGMEPDMKKIVASRNQHHKSQ